MFTQKNILASCIMVLLTACGSSGGGSPSTQSSPTAPKPVAPAANPSHTPKNTNTPAEQPANTPTEQPKVSLDLNQKNQDIFAQQLNQFVQSAKNGNLAKLSLNTDKGTIDMALLPDATQQTQKEFINDHQINALKDKTGQLLGYYGYAGIKKSQKDDYDNYKLVSEDYLYFNSMDESQAKRPDIQPNQTLHYSGSMLYHYPDSDIAKMRTAQVAATYSGADKTLSMNIHANEAGDNTRWTLHSDKSIKSQTNVAVSELGKVHGHLFSDNAGDKQYSGTFSGGLYGNNGDVLVGKVEHQEKDKTKLEGVIGATVKAQ